MKNWYVLALQAPKAAGAKATLNLSILDDIGSWGVTALDFIRDLNAQVKTATDAGTPDPEINMTISSNGGSVFDGLAMYNALRGSKLKITATVLGIAASAATLPLMAADKINMPKNTFLMVHDPSVGAYGNATEMRDIADTLDTIGASLINTYAARTGKTPEAIKTMLAQETWMSADEALANGFCNEVLPLMEVTASANVKDYSQKIQDMYAKAIALNPTASLTPEQIAAKNAKDAADALATENAAKAAKDAEALKTKDAETLKIAMGTTVSQGISALAIKAGLGEYTAALALDPALTTVELAATAIQEMLEIRALCEVAGMPEAFKALAEKRATMSIARTELIAAKASKADTTIVNGNNTNPKNDTVSSTLDVQTVYANRQPKEK